VAKKKRTKRKTPEPMVVLDQECSLELSFSRELQKDRETVRRLAHLVVDRMADSGRHKWLADSVAFNLACLADDIVISNVTDLIRKARAASKEVARG
jgi:hypothetical protein